MMMMVVGGIKGSLPVLIKIKIQNNCSMEILRLEALVYTEISGAQGSNVTG